MHIVNIAAYKFVALENLEERRQGLRRLCCDAALKGTILLSPEGINLFVAGERSGVDRLLEDLRQEPALRDLEVKESYSTHRPFSRMLIKLKKEIIPFGVDGIEPARFTGPKLAPKELRRWLDEGKDITLLDVRNDFEVEIGTFRGARAANITSFRDFPKAVESLPHEIKKKPMVMFCTGGIRCEKAAPLMLNAGFEEVYQIDGGILKYFEECGDAHYDGECFVFDKRVALDASLRETGTAQCYVCQSLVSVAQQQSPEYVPTVSCPACYIAPQEVAEHHKREREQRVRHVVTPELPEAAPYVNRRPLRVPHRFDGKTVIDFLCDYHSHISRDAWLESIAVGRLLLGERPVRADTIVRGGHELIHVVPDTVEPTVNPDIRMVFEDEALVAIDKPAPLPVHPCGRFNRNTVYHILQKAWSDVQLRSAHRLDANTTGLLVLTKSSRAARALQRQFEARTVGKRYLVQVHGHPPQDEFGCDIAIHKGPSNAGTRITGEAGVVANTHFRVVRRLDDGTALLEAQPYSGRTNQIRIHLSELGWPVVGDRAYGLNADVSHGLTHDDAPLRLHAWKLQFKHPFSGADVELEAPLPPWAQSC